MPFYITQGYYIVSQQALGMYLPSTPCRWCMDGGLKNLIGQNIGIVVTARLLKGLYHGFIITVLTAARKWMGGMTMRLIDADALNKELQQRVGSPTDDKLYEVNLCIIDAPAIDAISVKWLKERRGKHGPIMDVCIDLVLMEWQEDKNGRTMETF